MEGMPFRWFVLVLICLCVFTACGKAVDVAALYRDATVEVEGCIAGFQKARSYDEVTAVGKRWFEANREFEHKLEQARQGGSGAFAEKEAQQALARFTEAHQRLVEEQAKSYERFLGGD
jgi:uncharacterized membrane protein